MKEPIISIKEARKILGKEQSDQLSDEQVLELIHQMEWLSDLAIKDYIRRKGTEGLPPSS